MASSDVCPTKNAVQAFIESLVDPSLPSKLSIIPTPSMLEKVAKQVHSVVLLYNYYHRKQHPELSFLAFDEFCKLAVDLKPTLLAHMKFMQKPDETKLVDAENQLSLTEKMVMNACDICTCLDASKSVPNIKGWPISKVSVLLIDSKTENCSLFFGSITDGVWSIVEKDVETSTQSSEVTSGTTYTYKKKRVIKKPIKNELNVDEDGFLQVGYSAVEEATGVNKADIVLLERHTVYSLSKEKTASRFYIMKCSQLIKFKQESKSVQVPIKDLIESLQGPLVKESDSYWTITPVVEYFHVLPYLEIISEWISRETSSNSLQDSKLAEKNMMVDSPEVIESYVSSEGMSIGIDSKPSSNTVEALKQKENNGCCKITSTGSIKEAQDMVVHKSLVFPSENKEECQHIANAVQVSEDQEIGNPSVQHYSNGSTSPIKAEKVDSTRMLITDGGIKDQSACDKICAAATCKNDSTKECALIANNSNTVLEKLPIFRASKGKTLSQTALNVLIRKRNAQVLQQRMLEDDIALSDIKIQRMLSGGEDDIELMIESIIEGCNDTWVRNQGRMPQHLEEYQCLPSYNKKTRLSEAVISKQSSCQELDDICHENDWILPTYRVSHSHGAFQANVTLKGFDFERSCGGNPCSHPREARESAAAQMLVNLRNMAKSAK